MRRRDFIKGVVGLGATFTGNARAQDPGRTYRLGQLSLSPRDSPQNVALHETLKQEGFVDGQNLLVDPRGFDLRVDELVEHARIIVEGQIDILICGGDPAVRAAQQATKTIPIAGVADDMLKSGFVASLAKPEGNTTVTLQNAVSRLHELGYVVFETRARGNRWILPGPNHAALALVESRLAESVTEPALRV